ncbi:NUDIX hydrolase [Candidatus Saccharibacteria bacterium]|nr:NUDIX hydrolase [Candidatus Saccharibacteria bacterium]
MKKLWRFIGKASFWVSLPLLYVYLRIGRRTRVFIRCDDELLVVRAWLGTDSWIFPGGGLHRGEVPAVGAVREVYEETGIQLDPADLTFLFERTVSTPQKLSFRCIAYAIYLLEKPKLKPASGEITAIEWRSIDELCLQRSAEQLLKPALKAWDKLS